MNEEKSLHRPPGPEIDGIAQSTTANCILSQKAADKKDNKEDKEKENVVDAEVVDAKEDKEKRA